MAERRRRVERLERGSGCSPWSRTIRHNPNTDPAYQRIATHKTHPAISIARSFPSISILPPITDLLEQGAAVAIGVSGGKDECRSAFAFQSSRWLGDIAPHLLQPRIRDPLAEVRSEVSGMLGFRARYRDRSSIHARYAELLDMHASRGRQA